MMATIDLERERSIYQALHRRFIVLRKRYLFGVFPIFLCVLREEMDGSITEKRLKYKVRRYGDYPEYGACLYVEIDGKKLAYIIEKYAYAHLNFRDKSVWFEINSPEPLLGMR